jgi:hypothetical protein
MWNIFPQLFFDKIFSDRNPAARYKPQAEKQDRGTGLRYVEPDRRRD